MGTAQPPEEIREELRLVEDDLARLRETAADLRTRLGEGWDEPTDAEERTTLIESAAAQEALIGDLESRREELLQRLGQPER
jgi:outer membrane protein TolC